ncbi:MAG: response regulator transcription factor [Candidatus Acidiferrales bacterium]
MTSGKKYLMHTRLLIVDDSEPVRRGLRTLLQTNPGWEVCADAADGWTALDMFKNLRPHAVVLDFQMPGINGLETARRMLEIDPDVPIVMLTQHASPSLEEHALKIGIRSVVSKMDVLSLIDLLEQLLSPDGSPPRSGGPGNEGPRPSE